MAERDYFETLAEHLRELINSKPRSPSHEEVKSTLHLAVLSMIELEPEISQGVRALRAAPRDREAWDVARAARYRTFSVRSSGDGRWRWPVIAGRSTPETRRRRGESGGQAVSYRGEVGEPGFRWKQDAAGTRRYIAAAASFPSDEPGKPSTIWIKR